MAPERSCVRPRENVKPEGEWIRKGTAGAQAEDVTNLVELSCAHLPRDPGDLGDGPEERIRVPPSGPPRTSITPVGLPLS